MIQIQFLLGNALYRRKSFKENAGRLLSSFSNREPANNYIWIHLHDNVTNDISKVTKYDFCVKEFSFIIL